MRCLHWIIPLDLILHKMKKARTIEKSVEESSKMGTVELNDAFVMIHSSRNPYFMEIRNVCNGNVVARVKFPRLIDYWHIHAKIDPTLSRILVNDTLVDIKSNTSLQTGLLYPRRVVFDHSGTHYLNQATQCVREIDSGLQIGCLQPETASLTNSTANYYRGESCFSGDDTKVIMCGFTDSPRILVWDISTGKMVRNFLDHRDRDVHVTSPAGQEVVISVGCSLLTVWNYNDGCTLLQTKVHFSGVCQVEMCLVMNAVCVLGEKSVVILDLATGAVVSTCKHKLVDSRGWDYVESHEKWDMLAYSAVENVLVQGRRNGARVVDPRTGTVLLERVFDVEVEKVLAVGAIQNISLILL